MKLNLQVGILSVILIYGMLLLGQVVQHDFQSIIIAFAISFLAYYFILREKKFANTHVMILMAVGVLARLYYLYQFPMLSDDIYRFYWDGLLTQAGVNPYSLTPEHMMQGEALPEGIRQVLFDRLNSQSYFSIYPPIGQLIFYVSATASTISGFCLLIKTIFFLCEMASLALIIHLLNRLQMDRSNALVYFLNPLVIVEGMGNLHFEIVLIPFIVIFLLGLNLKRHLITSFGYVAAIATKITPLLLGPLVLYYYRDRKDIFQFLGIGFVLMVLFTIPIWLGVNFTNLGESVDLYFRKFEFNASIYYLLREVGYLFTGYNQIQYIGPLLGLTTIGSIIYLSSKVKQGSLLSFIKYGSFAYVIYLILATTVHPWYLIPLILFSVFYRMNAILLWSFLITLSYFTYSQENWQESGYMLFIEYALFLSALAYEWRSGVFTDRVGT